MLSRMKTSFVLLRFGLSILLTAAAAKGHADTSSNESDPGRPNAVVMTFAEADLGPASPEGELVLDYDPSKLDPQESGLPERADTRLLREEAAKMKTPAYAEELKARIIVPVAVSDDELLKNGLELSPKELDTFLKKKSVFLQKTARALGAIRIRPASINKLLDIMNKAFFRNAGVVASANTHVTNVQLGVALGAGLPDWLMKTLKRSPLLKDLPERVGFYFMLSTGFSIVATTKNGKLRFGIEPVIDVRRATRIFSPFAFGAAGFTGSFTWENRERDRSPVQKIGFYRVSSLNVFSSASHFGFSGSVAAAFPPGGGAIAGMEGEVYRFRVTPTNFIELVRSFVTTLRRLAIGGCKSLF